MSAPIVLLNDIFQVQILGTILSQKVMSVINYRVQATSGPAAYTAFTNQFITSLTGGALQAAYLAVTPTNYTLNSFRVQRVYPTRDAGLFGNVSLPGNWSSAVCNQSGTASVFWRNSDRAGRSQRSVTHIPALPQDAASSNALTTLYKANLATLATQFMTDVSFSIALFSYTLRPTIFHRKTVPTPTWDDPYSFNINTSPRTERKRVLGYGK